MNGHLNDSMVTIHVLGAVAAGVTNQTSGVVDLGAVANNADAIRFVADIGALTATQVTSLKLQVSDDNATWTDFAGGATAAMADGDSNKLLIVDVLRPLHRYWRAVVLRGTANAVINCVLAEVYRPRKMPVAQDATVSQSAKAIGA